MRMVGRSALRGLGRQQAGVDLAHGDRERLLLRTGVDQRADVLEQALVELRVVGVDLTRALGRVQDERVLGVGALEQTVDGRVGDAGGGGDGSGHGDLPYVKGVGLGPSYLVEIPIPRTSSSVARCTSSFTMTWSNSASAASSTRAVERRRSRSSASSVPRPTRRRSSSANDGGARNTKCASGIESRTCRAPCRSISRRAGLPAASRSATGFRGVPYRLRPCTTAHSSRSPRATIRSNSSPETNR